MENTEVTTLFSKGDIATSIRVNNTLSILYLAIGSVGLLGNSLVLVVLAYYKPMRKRPSNIYIGNQSALDLAVSSILILTTVFQDEGDGNLSGLGGEAYCKLWLTKFQLWGLFVSSSYNLVAITIERYLAVVYAIWHKMHFGKKQIWISVVFTWVIGLGYNAAFMIPTSGLADGGSCSIYSEYPSDTLRRFNGVFTIVIQYLVPLAILVFCYSRMALVLRSRVQPASDGLNSAGAGAGAGGKNAQASNMSRARKNIIKTLTVVSVCFAMCWVWNQVYFLMHNLGYDTDFTSTFYHFTVVAVFCNCYVNPFIYAAKYEQFQQGLKKLFCRKKAITGQESYSQSRLQAWVIQKTLVRGSGTRS